MKKRMTVLAAAVLMTSAVSCMKTVEPMDESDYVPVISTETSTEEQTTKAAEPTTEPTTVPIESPLGYQPESSACVIDVEAILQNPELPTGCEVTALATLLNYCGFEIDKIELCDNFMPISSTAEYTFHEAYIGDPRADNGFGCYAPVIVETAKAYFESVGAEWTAKDLTDTEFRDLFYQIDQGRPVVIWASMGLKDVTMKLKWVTADGDEAWFASLEHCMVLTGYDTEAGIVYAADPLKGNMEYSLERFESVYNQMGKMAVVVYEE